MLVQLVLWFVAIVVAGITHFVYKWTNPKCKGKLPPGSMGFPIIGESIQFFTPHSLYGTPPFVRDRVARYGSVFRTSIVGQKVIVSTDDEINYSIFQQEGKSFMMAYTESFTKIMGEQSMLAHREMIHKYLRNLTLHLVSPEMLKAKLLHEMNLTTCMSFETWANNGPIDVKEESSNMIFRYFAKKLMSYEEPNEVKKLKDNYNAFMDGLISFPLNIRGTAFHACLQGRQNVEKVISDIFQKRKRSKSTRGNDFLDHLIDEAEKEETNLDEKMAIALLFGLLFAAYETTSSAITLAVKYISDHPKVISELTKEHEAILRDRGTKDSELTWKEYKSMNFTHMVINETVRLANIVPGIFRRSMKDVQMKGYTIPAGWMVMVVPSVLHLDPNKYDDPLSFNPWRWQGKELHVGSKTFMAFGGGSRQCVGAGFAKLHMAIFLHHLVTKYRWIVAKEGNIVRKPGLYFLSGFHIQIVEKSNDKFVDRGEVQTT